MYGIVCKCQLLASDSILYCRGTNGEGWLQEDPQLASTDHTTPLLGNFPLLRTLPLELERLFEKQLFWSSAISECCQMQTPVSIKSMRLRRV